MLVYVLLIFLVVNAVALVPPSRSSQPKKIAGADKMGVISQAALTVGSTYMTLPILPVLAAASEQKLALTVGRPVLDAFVNILSLLMIIRTVLSWYPKTDLKAFPYSLVVWPTEPLLAPVRATIPPAFGVDVSSLVWVGVLSFVREVFTGQQGILTLMEKYPDTF